MTQSEFTYGKPTADNSDVKAVWEYLLTSEGATAEQIAKAVGIRKRNVRATAEASHGTILSAPGIAGYYLACRQTIAWYKANIRRRYLSQIKKMIKRLIDMDKAVYGSHADEKVRRQDDYMQTIMKWGEA